METIIAEQPQTDSALAAPPAAAPFIPEMGDPLRTLEHYHRYLYASRFTKNKRVLDVACGEGYGTAFLSLNATAVTGIDADELLIMKAKEKYTGFPQARFEVGRCEEPFAQASSADVVISFGTLEYLGIEARRKFTENVKAALKPGGIAVLAMPVRAANDGGQHYLLTPVEFSEYLREHFRHSLFVGQKPVTVSGIWSLYSWRDDYFRLHARDGLFSLPQADEMFAEPDQIIAICSDAPLSRDMADSSKSFYYDALHLKQSDELAARAKDLEDENASLEQSLSGLRDEVAERNVAIERFQHEIEEMRRRSAALEMTVMDRDSALTTLRNDLDNAHASLETLQQAYDLRTARANSLKEEQTSLSARFHDLHRSLEDKTHLSQQLGDENGKLRLRVAELEQSIADQNAGTMSANDELEQQRLMIKSLTEQIEERADTARLREEEVTALRGQVLGLQTLLDDRNTHVSASAEELAAYKEEIRILHEQIKEIQKGAASKTEEAELIRMRNAELEEKFGGNEIVVQERDEKIRQLSARLHDMEISSKEQTHLMAARRREVEEMTSKLDDAQRSAAEQADAAEKATKELDERREQFESSARELAERTQRVLALEMQVKDQTDFLTNIQRECEEHAMMARQLRGELDKQVVAFDTYQKSQSDLQQRYSKSQIRVQELQARLTMIEQKMEEITHGPTYKIFSSLGVLPKSRA